MEISSRKIEKILDIVNALIHRDYSIYTEKSYIKVFKYRDRIEIESPGGLYGKNRIEQLGSDTMLEVRNSSIVQILENEKTILENRHSGIPTMKQEMLKMNLPEPEFINERGTFKVIFYGSESDKVEGKSGKEEEKNINNTNKNSTLIKSDKVKKESKYSEKVLEYCVIEKSKKEIMAYIGINSQSYMSEKILKPLIESGELKYTKSSKSAKNQKYITVEKKL